MVCLKGVRIRHILPKNAPNIKYQNGTFINNEYDNRMMELRRNIVITVQ